MPPFLTDGQRDLLTVLSLVLSAVSVVLGVIPLVRGRLASDRAGRAVRSTSGRGFVAALADYLDLDTQRVRGALVILWLLGVPALVLAAAAAPPNGETASLAWQPVGILAVLVATSHCMLVFWWVMWRVGHWVKLPANAVWESNPRFMALVVRSSGVLFVLFFGLMIWIERLADGVSSRLGGLYAMAAGMSMFVTCAVLLPEYREARMLDRSEELDVR